MTFIVYSKDLVDAGLDPNTGITWLNSKIMGAYLGKTPEKMDEYHDNIIALNEAMGASNNQLKTRYGSIFDIISGETSNPCRLYSASCLVQYSKVFNVRLSRYLEQHKTKGFFQ